MAKNTIFDPTKDGVKADNSGYSSNQIDALIGQSAAAVIDDDAAGDDTVYSSAKIYSLLPEDTATGAEVTITDACPDLPIVELTAEINAVQETPGSDITGWDKITVTHDGTDVEISLGDDTIYGGTYNSDGTLTVKSKYINLNTLSYRYDANNKRWYGTVSDMVSYPARGIDGLMGNPWIPNLAAAPGNEGVFFGYQTVLYFYSLDEENPPEGYIVYPLATPVELTVGTLAFNTNREGSTIISCDSGDVTVKYKKLTTLS